MSRNREAAHRKARLPAPRGRLFQARHPSRLRQACSPEAPFGRDAIHLWYARRLDTLDTVRLMHRALNPLPGCCALQPRPLRACRRSFVSQAVELSEGSASEAADVETKRFGLSTGLSAAAERAFPEESALTRRDKGFLLSYLYGRGFSFLSWLFSSSAACLRSIASRSWLKWRSTTRRKPPSTM